MSIVYILTNEAMPGYIKIGRTETEVAQRMSSLDTTAVPLPFQCYFAARVENYAAVERMLHLAFGDFRVRNSREFFKMDPYKAKVVLEHIAVEDVTPRDDTATDKEGIEALEKASKIGSRYDMSKYGIPVGAVLQYTSDTAITCTVVDARTVDYRGEQVSLSRAAVLANSDRGGTATALQGPIWWLFEGETLASVRQRLDEAW
jgi:hypothetical protein